MRIYLGGFLVFLGLCTNSCSAEQEEVTTGSVLEESDLDLYFPDFPTNPVLNLQFDKSAQEVTEALSQNNFTELKSTEGTWKSEDQKAKIIVSPDAKLGNFKLYFFDRKDSFCSKLIEKLEKTAEKVEKSAKNEQFVYFEFETEANNFSISLFHYEKLIRMSYKLKASH